MKSIKKILILILSLTALMCSLLFISVTGVFADEDVTATGEKQFRMLGASIRYDETEGGIRFGVAMKITLYDEYIANGATEMGILAIPENKLTGELIYSTENAEKQITFDADGVSKWGGTLNGVKIDGYLQSAIYIYDIPAKNYNTKIMARAYVKKADGSFDYTDSVSKCVDEIAFAELKTETDETKKTQLQAYIDANDYTVKFVAGEEEQTLTCKYGETVEAPSVPEKKDYIGTWDGDFSFITADLTINAKYEKNVILNILNDTKDANDWSASCSVSGKDNLGVEVKSGGVYFTYYAPFYESEYYAQIDNSKVSGDYLVFYALGSKVPNIFVGFVAKDGTKYHYMYSGGPTGIENGVVVELSLSELINTGGDHFNVSDIEKLEVMVQDWTTQDYKCHTMFFSTFAVCNSFGLEKYKSDITTIISPTIKVINDTSTTEGWEKSHATNEAFAVIEKATEGLTLKYVSYSDDSVYKVAIDKTMLTEEYLVFYMKASSPLTFFVGLVDSDGNEQHVTLSNVSDITNGTVVVVNISDITSQGIDLTKVEKFQIMLQDWQTAFGWQEVNIQKIAVCDSVGLAQYKKDFSK